jgi:hypothetical protein
MLSDGHVSNGFRDEIWSQIGRFLVVSEMIYADRWAGF